MEQFLQILKEINIAQIVIVFIGLWFFYNRLDKKIDITNAKIDSVEERLNKKIDAVEDKLNKRMDLLDKKIDAVEERLNKRMDLLDKKIDAVQDKLTNRIDNLYNLFASFLYNKKDDNVA